MKTELVERLYNALYDSFDEDAIQANISFNLQLMLATVQDIPGIDVTVLPGLIEKYVLVEDFLPYWIDSFSDQIGEEDLKTLVNYFESDLYRRVNDLLGQVEPMVNQAMLAYATAISEMIMDEVMPGIPSDLPVN